MKILFSIVVLTLNEEKNLPRLLNSLSNSLYKYKSELIIIDSGSTDKTITSISNYKTKFCQCTIKKISPTEFNHGNTRNLGVSLARGKFVMFLSADACILSEDIFTRILNDFQAYPETKVIFAKQVANKNTSFIQSLDIDNLFEELDKYKDKSGLVMQNIKKPFITYKNDNNYLWYFSSNVCSCYPRIFLLTHPFKSTQHGEDIIMGKQIISDGFTKIYDSELIVQHSHNFSPIGYYRALLVDHRLKYFKLKLHYRFNLIKKIKKIFYQKTTPFQKIISFFVFIFYCAIKLFAHVTIIFIKISGTKTYELKIERSPN